MKKSPAKSTPHRSSVPFVNAALRSLSLQGETIEEALANLREATEIYLEEFPLSVGKPPLLTTFEVSENA